MMFVKGGVSLDSIGDQEVTDILLSGVRISYSKINNQSFLVQKEGEIERNNVKVLSDILFPFTAHCCQHLFFVLFDEEQDDNAGKYALFLDTVLKCWKYALKERKEHLEQLKVENIKAAHFAIETMGDIRQWKFFEKEELIRALIDYMEKSLDFNRWEQYDILMGRKSGQTLYGTYHLDHNSIDLAIPFIISNKLLEEFHSYYPFHIGTSSITVLKILQFPITNVADKITYNSDKSAGDKVLPVKDARIEDGIQINNPDSLYRNGLEEIMKLEHENNDYYKIGKEER